jgi:aminoglycoside phosphotransferase (APT) family kinase protein
VPEWSPEHVVHERLARRLIAGQCFEPESLRLLGEGWDNTVWLVDERWAFRFPRREIAIPGVRRELATLAELAPQLPLRVPDPVHVGEPALGYPWPFFGAEAITGREVCDVDLTHDARCALGRPLGQFLRALHAADVSAELPADPMGRSNMRERVPRTAAALKEIESLWAAPRRVFEALETAETIPAPDASTVVHCDLHVRHILLLGQIPCGVIDWGDVCRGDPGMDLALYWYLLPPDGRADFLAAYGDVTPDQLLSARVLAWFMSAKLAVYAHNEGRSSVLDEALAGLRLTTG